MANRAYHAAAMHDGEKSYGQFDDRQNPDVLGGSGGIDATVRAGAIGGRSERSDRDRGSGAGEPHPRNEGVLDAYGHVSVRHPTDPNRYLMARSLAPALITAADILEFDLNSKPVKPTEQRLFTERFIHGSIYQARPDVKAIVHSHSPTVIPFGIQRRAAAPVFHLGAFLYGGVPVFEISEFTQDGEMLVRDARLGDALAKALGAKIVALMRGHGNVVVGPSLQHACSARSTRK